MLTKREKYVSQFQGQIILGKEDGNIITVSTDDLAAMEKARDVLTQELAELRIQLKEAKTTGKNSREPEWYNKTYAARRFKGAAHQMLLRRIGEMKREERRNKHEALTTSKQQRFIQVARRRLPPELYLAIWNEVDSGKD